MPIKTFKPHWYNLSGFYCDICDELTWDIEHYVYINEVDDYDRIAKLFFIKYMIEKSVADGWVYDNPFLDKDNEDQG